MRARWRKTSSTSTTDPRSEEHTSELQSQSNLVCRLLLEKKKNKSSEHAARSSCHLCTRTSHHRLVEYWHDVERLSYELVASLYDLSALNCATVRTYRTLI